MAVVVLLAFLLNAAVVATGCEERVYEPKDLNRVSCITGAVVIFVNMVIVTRFAVAIAGWSQISDHHARFGDVAYEACGGIGNVETMESLFIYGTLFPIGTETFYFIFLPR